MIRSSARRALAIITVVTSSTAFAHGPSLADQCVAWLAAHAEVPTPVVVEELREVVPEPVPADLGAAIDRLVRDKRITVEQSRSQFTPEALDRFANLFLIFVTAELRARGFDDAQIADVLTLGPRAFGPTAQLALARAVTTRMLVTLNDEPSVDGPAGLEHFRASARAFELTEDEFAGFLALWRVVRDAPADAAVHLVLGCIRRLTGASTRERDQRRAAGWSPSWFNLFATQAPPTRGQIGRVLVADVAVPDFIADPPLLRPAIPRARFARYLEPTGGLAAVDLVPTCLRPLALARVAPDLDAGDLRRAMARPEYRGLDDETRRLIRADGERFAKLDDIRARLREVVRRDRERARQRPADPAVHRYFFEKFDGELTDVQRLHRAPAVVHRVRTLVTHTFDRTRAKFPRLGDADAVAITRRVIDAVAATDLLHATVAAARAMMLISRDFAFDDSERRSIVRQIRGYEFFVRRTHLPITAWTCAGPLLEENAWGRPAEPGPTELTRDLGRLVDRFRRVLDEDVALDDLELVRRLVAEPPRPNPSPSPAPPKPPSAPYTFRTFVRQIFTSPEDVCTEFSRPE